MQVDLIFSARIPLSYNDKKDARVLIQDLRLAEIHDLKQTRDLCTKWLSSVDGWKQYLGKEYKELTTESKYDILTEQFQRFSLNCSLRYVDGTHNTKAEVVFDSQHISWHLLKTLTDSSFK